MNFKAHQDDWFKVRSYLHFDLPIGRSKKDYIKSLVESPGSVSKHSFYPFITHKAVKYKTITKDTGRKALDKSGRRPLSRAAHKDAHIYSYYAKKLGVLYEDQLKKENISENVLAFRKLTNSQGQSKCNIHLADDAFEKIKEVGDCEVYAFDVKQFFDSLNHQVLKICWANLIGASYLPRDHFSIYKSLAPYAFVYEDDIFKKFPKKKGQHRVCTPIQFRTEIRGGKDKTSHGDEGRLLKIGDKGIPQGSPISSILANIYMLDFDKELNKKIQSYGGSYYRYCDDILCIIPLGANVQLEGFIEVELEKLSLVLNQSKTEKRKFLVHNGKLISDKPIQYLGFMFDGERKYIRVSSISRYKRKVIVDWACVPTRSLLLDPL